MLAPMLSPIHTVAKTGTTAIHRHRRKIRAQSSTMYRRSKIMAIRTRLNSNRKIYFGCNLTSGLFRVGLPSKKMNIN